jgi:hypothetical protein
MVVNENTKANFYALRSHACHVQIFFQSVWTKYLRYSCGASDFGHKRDDTVQNFVKTESFRPRKTWYNTVNFR